MAGGKTQTANRKQANFAPAILSIFPKDSTVVVAVGSVLRGYDLQKVLPLEFLDKSTAGGHGNAIRALLFSPDGKLLASAGDDKLAKLWNTTDWTCFKTFRASKKISSLAFSSDGKWLTMADKYGVVSAVPTSSDALEHTPEEPTQLLAHCCSTITSLAVSPDGKYIASADRDFKTRVTEFPSDPSLGAHSIQSFCLGHTSYITCIAFLNVTSQTSSGVLVSGAADGTVKLWDPLSGRELASVSASLQGHGKGAAGAEEAGLPEETGSGDIQSVSCLAVSSDGIIAVAVESSPQLLLLKCDAESLSLSEIQRLDLHTKGAPTSLQFAPNGDLWMVVGAAEAHETDDAFTSEQAFAATAEKSRVLSAQAPVLLLVAGRKEGRGVELLQSDGVPGGKKLLATLQGGLDPSAESLAFSAALKAEVSMRKELSKREFSLEEREHRKRGRSDKR